MKKLTIFLIMVGCFLGSCKKGYLDINSDPNNPTSVPPTVILSNILIGTAFTNANDLNRATSVLVQHTAGVANQVQQYDIFI
jgi:hypothetical protein